ncbi:unnamed protein product [Bursaphelenchus okinawaensis]|uniref:Granulins domain-containing protein n=1 Tax=Bursaphelenchus okinawaensis TaxID=465554 RepID=A0A811JVW8_9BILA|nr:unnamed protein product [Bursaphelenchus okinawaensis]CAG9085509.1 unnamed protein product [Bursaphelenchus okinawaensis]
MLKTTLFLLFLNFVSSSKFQNFVKSPKDDVKCSDGKSVCPSETTCCDLGEGAFGCCPVPDAVCCEDKLHCCPSGMVCDTKEAKCTFGFVSHPLLKKIPAKLEDSACDNPSYQCPIGTTCCAAKGELPGCCPLPNAVCCPDGKHCCPHKTTCDVQEQRCLTEFDQLPWFKGFAAFREAKNSKTLKKNNINCSGNEMSCQNSKTNEEFCCPFSDGVCCEGKSKCCPFSFSCSPDTDDCVKEGQNVIVTMKSFP